MLSYIELSKLDSIEGNFAQALEHYKMHTLYKDSLFNEESNKQTSQLKIQYETEKKDREIELLNKENEIKALQLNQQKVSLLASRLEAEKTQSKLLLMDNNREIQELKLAETQKDLDRQQAEAEVRAAEMELLNKDKEIQGQQLEKQKLLRNGMFAGALLLLLAGLLLFRSFRLRKKLEKQHAIIKERKRIGADLHDDVGSGLSKIILLSELVKKEAKTPETKKEAQKISAISQDLSSNISEIIWALNANNDYVENMLAYIRRYAAEYFENSPVKLKITVPDNIAHIAISSEHRRNVFYTVKEALHNIIKHANAGNAELSFALQNDILTVVIRDDGIGMPQGELNRFGNGLKNMRNRMTSIDGVMNIESHQGTKVTLSLPL
jgi:signal transduction histidine kinase